MFKVTYLSLQYTTPQRLKLDIREYFHTRTIEHLEQIEY